MNEEDPFADSATPTAAPAPVVDEFKFTREWNMQFRERCEAKDKEAMEKKQEILRPPERSFLPGASSARISARRRLR